MASDAKKKSAKEILDRAEREIRRLTELGVDVAALRERFEVAKGNFAGSNWSDVEMACGEILVLAKSMQAITSASMAAGSRGKGKLSESQRMEMSRLISAEVANRVEAVARQLPTASALEETVQLKIQEALVTGGLVTRLESIASDKAQAAVSGIPRFTAKDAQSAANLVVQRALTQFLSGRELGTRVAKVVEEQLSTAVDKVEKKITKSVEALANTRVADGVARLPTNEFVAEAIREALASFVKDSTFEDRVLELAAERAKAEVERAPDLMSEAASRIARQEADALFKATVRSQEFVSQIKQAASESANEIVSSLPTITREDVEVISRTVAEESLGQLAESDVLREKIEAKAKEIAAKALSEAGLDEKIAAAIAQSRTELITDEAFSSWIKDGALEVLKEAGFGDDMAELRKGMLTEGKVEKIARGEVTDFIERKDFTRRIAEVLDEKAVRTKLEEIAGDAVTVDQIEQTAEFQAKSAISELLESPELAAKVQEVAGSSQDVQNLSRRLIEGMKKIEKEALPALIEKILDGKLDQALDAKVGAISPEAIQANITAEIGEKIAQTVNEAVASLVSPEALQEQVNQIASNSIRNISNSPDFKAMLDTKFKVATNYLTQQVIPKQIRRIMGGG